MSQLCGWGLATAHMPQASYLTPCDARNARSAGRNALSRDWWRGGRGKIRAVAAVRRNHTGLARAFSGLLKKYMSFFNSSDFLLSYAAF
jgi:hypothetical protein